MALGVSAPSVLDPHVKAYHENVRQAKPVGAFVNDQWLSATVAYCGEENTAARELAAMSLKTFFGPDRPYLKDQVNVYEHLIEQWGGVPDHLKANFARYLKKDELSTGDAPEVDLSGGSGAIAQAIWNQLDADTLAERGVMVAGDPESCLKAIRIHEAIGVDQLQFLMATETIPHEKVMTSIELFGKYVIPELRQSSSVTA
jgi:alkanesulfonate monooxygenase SsuD/methylene tetrahydromethanopterin reductase-like flavin-dependent oxidoreductase (luciferase family)